MLSALVRRLSPARCEKACSLAMRNIIQRLPIPSRSIFYRETAGFSLMAIQPAAFDKVKQSALAAHRPPSFRVREWRVANSEWGNP